MGFPTPENSPVYWEIQKADGTWFSLHTYAWSVQSFGGRRFVAGAKRGEDVQLPHRRGKIYVPKTRDSQALDMTLWVMPTNMDGTRDATKTTEQKAHENYRKIIAAVDQEGQFLVRKRWFLDNARRDYFLTDVASAIGTAEFLDGSGPTSDDGHDFSMSLTLSMVDPYFYGRQIITGYSASDKAADANLLTDNSTTNITLQGDAPTDHIWLSISNFGSSSPKITFPDGNWVQLLSAGLADTTSEVIIDCKNALAIRKSLAAYLGGDFDGTYLNGQIRRNPYFQNWPVLNPMKTPTAQIQVSGTGTIKLLYDPSYR